ncbi:magnesium transporter [Nostocales cyanobacterium LEGE 11386]|nr:magnesium transporter [Nostocales cyanobacterium LEGE 11386]
MRQNALNNLSLKPCALEVAKQTANQLNVTELMRSLSEIEPKKRVLAFRLLEKSKAITVFEYLSPNKQADLIREMENPEVMTIIEALGSDDRVKLFEELPAKIAKRLITNLSPQARESVNLLLGYPERTAGRLMNLRYLAVRNHITVGAALASVQESNLQDDELEMVFLIDSERFYRGFIRTVRLIKANPDTPIEMLLDGANVAVRTTDPEMQAAQMLKDFDLPALPVVDSEGRLLGDITFDDVIDLIQEEAAEAALSKAGVGNLLSRDKVWSDRLVRGNAWYSIRLRILFLIVTLIGGMLVGGLIERFEEVLEAVVAAAVFIPLVMDMGGNVGTQSTTIFARGLAWNHININQIIPYLLRETRIGAIMGVILGVTAGGIAYVWQGAPNGVPLLGLAVGLSLFCVVTLGAFLGGSLPWIMLKLGFDHGPGADPFITTIKDFTGLWIYFSLVGLLLGIEG